MNQKMLKTRTVAKLANKLLIALKEDDPNSKEIPIIEALAANYDTQYKSFKQIEHEPSVVYQLYGKKTVELTPEENRAYKALLKRQRDARRRELRGL